MVYMYICTFEYGSAIRYLTISLYFNYSAVHSKNASLTKSFHDPSNPKDGEQTKAVWKIENDKNKEKRKSRKKETKK